MDRKRKPFIGFFGCNCGEDHDGDPLECPEIDFGGEFRFDAGGEKFCSAAIPGGADEFGFSADPVFQNLGAARRRREQEFLDRKQQEDEAAVVAGQAEVEKKQRSTSEQSNYKSAQDHGSTSAPVVAVEKNTSKSVASKTVPPVSLSALAGVQPAVDSASSNPLSKIKMSESENNHSSATGPDTVARDHLKATVLQEGSTRAAQPSSPDSPASTSSLPPSNGAEQWPEGAELSAWAADLLSEEEAGTTPRPVVNMSTAAGTSSASSPLLNKKQGALSSSAVAELSNKVALVRSTTPTRTKTSSPSRGPPGSNNKPLAVATTPRQQEYQSLSASSPTFGTSRENSGTNSSPSKSSSASAASTTGGTATTQQVAQRSSSISGKVFVRRNNYFHQENNVFVSEYLENCRAYQINIDPGVVSCLQTDGQDLYIHCEGLLAVASILCNPKNPPVTRLHVMARYETRANQYVCLILEQILHANRTLEVLDFADIGINSDGMGYLTNGLTYHPSVRQLLFSRNDLGPKGAKWVIKVCATIPHLEKVDVRFCEIGATYSYVLGKLSQKHPKHPEMLTEGNIDIEELWGAITHGLGLLWSIVAGIYMTTAVRNNPGHHVMACLIYSVCHVLLFLFSTLYHSLFMQPRTAQVFQILDHCGIFLFIAASYTPIVEMSDLSKSAAVTMLVSQWCLALFGSVAFIVAFYFEGFKAYYGLIEPYHRKKLLQLHICWNFCITKLLDMAKKTCDAQTIRENTQEMRLVSIFSMTEIVCLACLPSECVSVTLFSHDTPFICLAMGWMIMWRYEDVVMPMPDDVATLLVVGGVLYTVGVVFLLTDKYYPIFHVFWHLFVLAASICHWFSILSYAEYGRKKWEAEHPPDAFGDLESSMLIKFYSEHFDKLKESITFLVGSAAAGRSLIHTASHVLHLDKTETPQAKLPGIEQNDRISDLESEDEGPGASKVGSPTSSDDEEIDHRSKKPPAQEDDEI
ncbi:unnamed protein product [Amoebophrya sp. A120]|nr:unnamed protein product [Amoebophrya sp. A120]|eukprot:GSA120T00002036001.1